MTDAVGARHRRHRAAAANAIPMPVHRRHGAARHKGVLSAAPATWRGAPDHAPVGNVGKRGLVSASTSAARHRAPRALRPVAGRVRPVPVGRRRGRARRRARRRPRRALRGGGRALAARTGRRGDQGHDRGTPALAAARRRHVHQHGPPRARRHPGARGGAALRAHRRDPRRDRPRALPVDHELLRPAERVLVTPHVGAAAPSWRAWPTSRWRRSSATLAGLPPRYPSPRPTSTGSPDRRHVPRTG